MQARHEERNSLSDVDSFTGGEGFESSFGVKIDSK